MQITVTTRDTITPDLLDRYRASQDKIGIHTVLAMQLQIISKRAFTDSALRPAAWPNKADGSAATLRKSGTLAKSIRAIATATAATITTDRKYAAIHQLGGRTSPHVIRPLSGKALKTPFGFFAKVKHPGSKIPARPFMPFRPDGRPTPLVMQKIDDVLRAKLRMPK